MTQAASCSHDEGRPRPRTEEELWQEIKAYTGAEIAREAICPGHHAPWSFFSEIHLGRPPLALLHGPRGGGKSFLSALDLHWTCRDHPGHEARILGGSKGQSEQVYRALREAVFSGQGEQSDAESIARLFRDRAVYRNGSEVAILAASSTSVRGPHVPTLKLDEVDEIDLEIREAAMGMCINRRGLPASVVMTSTWHRARGPMTELLERARGGDFPLYVFCVFEVLERCPDARSGPRIGLDSQGHVYERCGECPLKASCYADHNGRADYRPKAKRSNGHYAIDALIQKVKALSLRTFEAEYLCSGPKTDGLWFPGFDPALHVSTRAEYDPNLAVHVAIDSGLCTGAVFFQIAPCVVGGGLSEEVRIFADYLREDGSPAEKTALEILEIARTRCNGRISYLSTDPAGGARSPVGITVLTEYQRAGLGPLDRWPSGSVADGLALIESFLQPADGQPRLLIHPRCHAMVQAMQNYRRARRSGQWQDRPEDPQHPHEDMMDALRGGLRHYYPNGRSPRPSFARVPARQAI